jgi:N-acetyl-gamma-glutamylphosphate reductase
MAEITVVTSRGQKGKPVDSVHPSLKNLIDLNFEDVDPAGIAKKCDVVFTAVPHGAAMTMSACSRKALCIDQRRPPAACRKVRRGLAKNMQT